MEANVLILGATGHIGSTVLDGVLRMYPSLSVRAVVRSQEDSDTLLQKYTTKGAHLATLIGSLEEVELLLESVLASQIVINCCPDVPYADSIARILQALASQTDPRFYIHTSGAARVWADPDGDQEGRIWDDTTDTLPVNTTHAITDQIVAAANTSNLRTAAISPPFVVGLSPSATHPTPLVYPDLVHVLRHLGSGFTISAGKNMMCFIDVKVLADLFLSLVGDALRVIKDSNEPVNPAIWGPEAYYFLSSFEMPFCDFMTKVLLPTVEKHEPSILQSGEIKRLSVGEVTDIILGRHGGGGQLWSRHIAEGFGVSMWLRGSRAEKYLGLAPKQTSAPIEESVAEFLATERRLLA